MRLGLQVGFTKVGLHLLDQLGGGAFKAEKLSVKLGSVMALIGSGSHDRNHFPLSSGQSCRFHHQDAEQLSERDADFGAYRE
jgi:hypothetical protein